MTRLLIWCAMALAAKAECISVTGDKIFAGDLAKAIPEFQSAPPSEFLSYAPIPGLSRNLGAAEVVAFAKRLKVTLNHAPARDVCFISAAAVLTLDQIRAAILAAVTRPVVYLEILDFTRSPLPPGRLDLPNTGLTQLSANGSAGARIWHGRLVTEGGRSFPVWVKLNITIRAQLVVSTHDLAYGQTLTAADVAYLTEVPFPLPQGALTSLDDATGRLTLRDISKGAPLLKGMLEEPREVLQGQLVHVDAICGDAHLSFAARAETSGRRGDQITVRNPNGRTFRALVVGKGRVEVRSAIGG